MKLKYSFEMVEMDEDIVAVPAGEDENKFKGLVKMNKSASEIFELLKEENSEESIAEMLSKKYDTDYAVILEYVKKYLGRLKRDGLLV